LLHIASEQQKNPRYAGNVHIAASRNRGGPGTRRSHPLPRQAGAGTPKPLTTAQAGRAG
jgi:hypothetical protein